MPVLPARLNPAGHGDSSLGLLASAIQIDHLCINKFLTQRLGHRNAMVAILHVKDPTHLDQLHLGQLPSD